ncbi:MAG: hypothetical protein IIB11_05335 [Chloroflexi bacterium]|nr:hypothetical protein [Chloroflexota bacterium]
MDLLVLGAIRDIIFIVFFGLGTLLLLILLVIAFLIYKKIGGLMDSLRGNLESSKVTLGNVAATSSLIADAVIKPIIKTYGVFAGSRKALGFLVGLSKKMGGR